MTRKFSEVLEEYLEERDRLKSDYYIGAHVKACQQIEDLAKELDEMVHGVEE